MPDNHPALSVYLVPLRSDDHFSLVFLLFFPRPPQCRWTIDFDGDAGHAWHSNVPSSHDFGQTMVHYGTSRQWEAVFFKRGRVLSAGRHTVAVWGDCDYGGAGLNGMGMGGFFLRAA